MSRAETVLRELVALKRLHDRIELLERDGSCNFVGEVPLPIARDDYTRRKSKAWQQAFDIVDSTQAAPAAETIA